MSLNSIIKKLLIVVLKPFGKEYLLEYWQIKRNEQTTLVPIIKFYKGFITKGMKIIDVGANVGTYSTAFVNFGAKVVGMEPQSYCQKILQRRFKGENNFKLIPLASGASNSTSEIHKSNSHTIASMNTSWINNVKESKRFKGEDWTESERIEVTTLDDVIKQTGMPDYIKIDVEGFELEVLKGLHEPVDFISFEITLPEMKTNAIDCVLETSKRGDYKFIIPNCDLSEISTWYSQAEIIEQIEILCSKGEKVSSDIFCKKVKI